MKYYIEIEQETELPIVWDDDRVSNYVCFPTIETDIEECVEKNGVIYASYETLDVGIDGYEVNIIDSLGAPCTHVIPEGEYGLHPTLTSITEAEFNKI